MRHRSSKYFVLANALALALAATGCSGGAESDNEPDTATEESADASAAAGSDNITDETFGCISDMTAVDRFFVDNLDGNLDATIAVAKSKTGGTYPVGSVVQLVPAEVMVKRKAGFDAATKDWEFFELAVSKEGTKITKRGAGEVVNQFGTGCLECHEKAEPQWDLICQLDHGCDPIPLTDVMIRGLQKTDPRCAPQSLTVEEKEGLKMLQEMKAAAAAG